MIIIEDRYELKRGVEWGEAISFLDDNMELFGLDETRMYERYLENVGFFSAGVFYKDMADFIYNESTTFLEGICEDCTLERPENGESAFIYGFEA